MLSITDFAGRTGEMVALLKRLVEIESPSTDKAAVDRLGAVVAEELGRLGAAVTIDAQTAVGDNVIGQWGEGEEGLLVLCHMDTVFGLGTLARQPWREVNDKVMGPGVVDMKASIALALTVLAAFKDIGEWPARPITTLFTSDEETRSTYSRAVIERLAKKAALALCLEPISRSSRAARRPTRERTTRPGGTRLRRSPTTSSQCRSSPTTKEARRSTSASSAAARARTWCRTRLVFAWTCA